MSHRLRGLVLLVFVAMALMFVAEALAQETLSPQAIRRIRESQAVTMNPAVIAASRERVALPAPPGSLTVQPGEPAAEPPPVADATSPPIEAAREEPAAAPPSQLTSGQLYFVQLSPRLEAQARRVVAHRVAVTQVKPASLQSFEGAVRQVTTNNVEVQLKPYVLVGQPLKFTRDSGTFTGSIAVGATDLGGAVGSPALSAPLLFQVLETREQKVLNQLSPPFEFFDVATDVTGASLTLRVASNFSPEALSVIVPVEPTLFVEVDNDVLRGLGLQTTRVTVRAVGGAPAPGATVSLSAPNAFIEFIDDDAPTFDSEGLAHARLRSDSPGKVTVRAMATGFVAGTTPPLTVFWPWQTLVATILGGLVGGFIRLGSRIRRGMNTLRFAVGLAIAALTGVLVFALYVLGVKLLPVSFGVEVGDLFAFAAAALGGWLGTGVLPQLKPADA